MSEEAPDFMPWKRHAYNRDFEWEAHSGPYRRITELQAREFDERGFFVLEDVFDAGTVRKVVSEIDPFEADNDASLRERKSGRLFIERAGEITFTSQLTARAPFFRKFCSGEVFQDLAHDLVGPDVQLYVDQAVYKKPGMEQPFPWHQDNGYAFIEPQRYLTCWIALTGADESNGCPWILPEIHRRGTLVHRRTEYGWVCAENPKGAVAVPLRPGSIAVFSSLTPHSTGPNRSDDVRKSYIVQFAPMGAEVLSRNEMGCVVRELVDLRSHTFPILVGGETPFRGASSF